MTAATSHESSSASFFLAGPVGDLFAVYYPPARPSSPRRDVLYVHPFAGELNNSRQLVAALARELARSGWGVLTVDLYGCGDSAGTFGDARWEVWRQDLAAAVRWLKENGSERLTVWGLRLGALLALDFATQADITEIVLWQPILSGRQALTQFLHMNLLPGEGSDWLRQRLRGRDWRRTGGPMPCAEVAGYDLSPELVAAIDEMHIEPLASGSRLRSVHWMEVVSERAQPMTPASLRVIEAWRSGGVSVQTSKVVGWPFWLFPHSIEVSSLRSELVAAFGEAVR